MAGSWYLFDGARQLGPLSLSELKHFLEVESLSDVQVWRERLKEWAAPSDLPEFAPVEPPPIPTISEDGRGQGADDDIATKPHRFNNFVARNWRGEFSLGTTYWSFGFLGNLFAGVLAIAVMAAFQSDGGYEPRAIFCHDPPRMGRDCNHRHLADGRGSGDPPTAVSRPESFSAKNLPGRAWRNWPCVSEPFVWREHSFCQVGLSY
jgi:hypothetical protein